MKKIILAVLALSMLAGCASFEPRTGSVCIAPFDTKSYMTNDPTQIKQDVADKMNEQLNTLIKQNIREETKMIFTEDCTLADYILSGKTTKLNVAEKGRQTWTGLQQKRLYNIEVSGELKSKSGNTIVLFSADQDNRELLDVLDSISSDIVKEIKFDNTKPLKK